MKAHIRIRSYPRRSHGWLAWGMHYQGSRLPLAADEPDMEITPAKIDSKSTIGRLWKWETPRTEDAPRFICDVMVLMKEMGHDKTPEATYRHAKRTFHQAKQEDHVDTITIERMIGEGTWICIGVWERHPVTGKYVDTLGLIKPGFLDEKAN